MDQDISVSIATGYSADWPRFDSRHFKESQPYAPAALYPPGRFLVLISVTAWVDPRAIVQLEGLDQLKNPMASSGIEPMTFQLIT
jgi:hypothetical protein